MGRGTCRARERRVRGRQSGDGGGGRGEDGVFAVGQRGPRLGAVAMGSVCPEKAERATSLRVSTRTPAGCRLTSRPLEPPPTCHPLPAPRPLLPPARHSPCDTQLRHVGLHGHRQLGHLYPIPYCSLSLPRSRAYPLSVFYSRRSNRLSRSPREKQSTLYPRSMSSMSQHHTSPSLSSPKPSQ